jgi:hypothetical protein
MAKEQGEEGRVVAVTAHDREREVLVSVPMEGFPEGFKLAPGARVLLVNSPAGPVVRPLVMAIRAEVTSDLPQGRGELRLGTDRIVELQDATVVATQDSPEASGAGDVVWVVESQDPEGPDQVIAVRRGRPRRE